MVVSPMPDVTPQAGAEAADGKETASRSSRLVVGLTGGIATGKSTVAAMLREKGAVVIDADVIAREVVEPGRPALEEIAARFGPHVIGPDGRLDRRALGAIVFQDDAARKQLEDIVHPRIMEEMERRLQEAPQDAVVVLDVPLLFETERWLRRVDVVVTVYADRPTQIRRIAARDGLPREEVERRLAAQWPTAVKMSRSDYVLYNQRDYAALARQVDDLWRRLTTRETGSQR